MSSDINYSESDIQNGPPHTHNHLLHNNNNFTKVEDSATMADFRPFQCHDKYNNYTFSAERRKGTTFIRPVNIVNSAISTNSSPLVELKVGVLLPFHQNNSGWTRIMTLSGISAIRLAVAEINGKNMIPGAYITLVEKDSFPKAIAGQAAITQAVYSSISLIQEGVIGVIGDIASSWTSLSALMTSTLQIPQCSFSAIATSLSDKSQFGYFFRTVPTNLLYSDAAISFIVSQGWPQLAVLYSSDDFSQQLSENVVMKARLKGITIKAYQSFYENGPKSDIQKSIDALSASGARVIFIAAEGAAQLAAMTVAAHSGYINDNTVWITIGADANTLYAAINDFNSILERRKSGTDIVPTIYNMDMDSNSTSSDSTISTSKKKSMLDLIDPVEYSARLTTNLNPINYNSTFSGGVFMFDILKELPGYPPFDEFLEKWSRLDPAIYPYGGQPNISSNEGLAYSCMMVMANGFNKTIHQSSTANGSNSTEILQKLAAGQLGQYLTPSAFNTSFVGPEGPVVFDQNGDVINGNFKVYNIQNGSQIEIGKIVAGNMNLTSMPIYHDGTTKVPAGVPDRTFLNPGYNSPVTIALLAISGIGTFVALLSIVLVLVYRKRQVFKASSPLFCILELIGFILAYISLLFFVGYRSKFTCTIIPITFHLGYSLILGNLIAKNYRIYRIFHNIFITRTIVTDIQLLRVSGSIFAITAIILVAWFTSSTVTVVNVPVGRDAYYQDCAFEGVSHTVFVSLLTLLGSIQLLFATFLAFKTRSVGRNYTKYSEYKQIGLSVYNIFFSVLIGFIMFFVPTTDYYTRYYLTAAMIVWATTFSLLVLFIPKIHAFFSSEKKKALILGKLSDISGRQRIRNNNTVGTFDNESNKNTSMENLNSRIRNEDAEQDANLFSAHFDFEKPSDLMDISKMMAKLQNSSSNSKVKLNNINGKGRMQGVLMEVHEAQVPLQYRLKCLSFLAPWEMMKIVLMPGISYFSFFSEKTNKGRVFAYSHSTIASAKQGKYVLKIHGAKSRFYDILIQVETEKDLVEWNTYFNTNPCCPNFSDVCTNSDNKNEKKVFSNTIINNYANVSDEDDGINEKTLFSSGDGTDRQKKGKDDNFKIKTKELLRKRITRQARLDSGITAEHLLREDSDTDDEFDDDETRRGSEATVATFDSCLKKPVFTAVEYGEAEINHVRQIQEQRSQQQHVSNSGNMTLGNIAYEGLGSNTTDTDGIRTSFYSSFANYMLSQPDLTSNNMEALAGSESTLAITENNSSVEEQQAMINNRSSEESTCTLNSNSANNI